MSLIKNRCILSRQWQLQNVRSGGRALAIREIGVIRGSFLFDCGSAALALLVFFVAKNLRIQYRHSFAL